MYGYPSRLEICRTLIDGFSGPEGVVSGLWRDGEGRDQKREEECCGVHREVVEDGSAG